MSINQDVTIHATPAQVYETLLDSDKFAEMTGGRAADISTEVGGAVSLFGGDIQARNIEMVPGKRLVQAWRSMNWPEGVYSIVRFDLTADGDKTALSFHQAGFPDGAEEMLEGGWHQMYWNPMNALFA